MYRSTLAALLIATVSAMAPKSLWSKVNAQLEDEDSACVAMHADTETNPVEYYKKTAIDHYVTQGAGGPTYQMRYLVDDTFWDRDNGPILFYAGNEGDVCAFFTASGFMTKTLAQEFGGLVVFGEHRFYGKSMPFGTKEETYQNQNYRYLTVQQAMMDYVELIHSIKDQYNIHDRAVIAFGGSYGGMLASWLRMKFPATFQGALAASAPILFYEGKTPSDAYNKIASESFKNVSQSCYDSIQKGFQYLDTHKSDASTYQTINDTIKICDGIAINETTIEYVIGYFNDELGTEAMVNYPYSTNFIHPNTPAFPVTASCNAADAAVADDDTGLKSVFKAAQAFYDYAETQDCLNPYPHDDGSLDTSGWNIQACGEMVMPFSCNASNCMFLPEDWNQTQVIVDCVDNYDVVPQFDFALNYFGGMREELDFIDCTNIIFSNGQYDPWRAGGVNVDVGDCMAIFIEQSAHHLDLRSPNAEDPETVTEARNLEKALIKSWIDDFHSISPSSTLSKMKVTQ